MSRAGSTPRGLDPELNRAAELERALLTLERYLPYARKHLIELVQLPTPQHAQQFDATLRLLAQALLDLQAAVPQRTP